MSGFETSRFNTGIVATAKQHGSILRGDGPPVPQAGVTGDMYTDRLTFQLFEKRNINGLDAWGHYLWVVPPLYRTGLKWFGASPPDDTLGIVGDYFLLWAGYDNYGMQPTIFGPKTWEGWPGTDDEETTTIVGDGAINRLGLLDEGPDAIDMMRNQLIAIGIFDEYIIPFPVTANPGDTVIMIGLTGSGTLVIVAINPLYTAEDEHAI